LEGRRSKNDKMLKRIWKAIETRAGEIRVVKAKERREKKEEGKKMRGSKKRKKKKNNRSKKDSRKMRDLE